MMTMTVMKMRMMTTNNNRMMKSDRDMDSLIPVHICVNNLSLEIYVYKHNCDYIKQEFKVVIFIDLDYKLLELKNEYVRIQGDLEKLESTGNNTSKMEERLARIEQEISETKTAIRNQK